MSSRMNKYGQTFTNLKKIHTKCKLEVQTPESTDERRRYKDVWQIKLNLIFICTSKYSKKWLLTGRIWCCELDLVHLPPQMGLYRHPVKVPREIGSNILVFLSELSLKYREHFLYLPSQTLLMCQLTQSHNI